MAKEKTPCKNGKTGKFAEEQDNASKDSFQNNEAIANVFISRLTLRKGNLNAIIMYGKFWFDGDLSDRNLDVSVELRQYQSLSPRKFFIFLTEWYSFFLLRAFFFVCLFDFFSNQYFLLLFNFP